MNQLLDFKEKFRIDQLKIYESKHWIWSLRPHQATLGAGILSLKRECATFAELEQREFADLSNIIKVIEPTLKRSFKYDVINYLMLMMLDKHVHYHIFPRYERSVEILGEVWKDESWPSVPQLGGEQLSSERLQEISQFIKSKM